MKQVQITDTIRQRLEAAGADPAKVAVFETVALNQLPVRKNHPLYKGAVHSRSMLQEMATTLNGESLPLQAQHDSGPLPFGRAFYGEVLDANNSGGSELRVLFWVDKTFPDIIDLIDNGTVDQVSVSVLAAEAMCSACNYNFLAEDADIENIWTGTCPDGHQMGLNGNYAKMTKLGSWFELSLVGKGGATGARIAGRSETRLAADGTTAHPFALSLTAERPNPETSTMNIDVNKLISDLSDARGQLLVATAEKDRSATDATAKDAKITELTSKVTELEAKVTELQNAAPEKGEVELAALMDVAKHILTLAGKVTDEVPNEPAKIVELVKGLKLSLATTGAQGADSHDEVRTFSATAFKSARR